MKGATTSKRFRGSVGTHPDLEGDEVSLAILLRAGTARVAHLRSWLHAPLALTSRPVPSVQCVAPVRREPNDVGIRSPAKLDLHPGATGLRHRLTDSHRRRWFGLVTRRTQAIAVLVVSVLTIGLLGLWAITRFTSDPVGADVNTENQPTTAPVVRTDLVDQETLEGTIRYADPGTVLAQSPGVITALPTAGDLLAWGDIMFELNEIPVVLLQGDTPAWRAMTTGTPKGTDVVQLEGNLSALGFELNGDYVDEEGPYVDATRFEGRYDALTAELVKQWQASLGTEQTGVVELGQVVFLPEPVRIAGLGVEVGSPVAAGSTLLTISATHQEVQLWLDADDQDLISEGDSVRVELPDGTMTPGVVEEISTVVTTIGTGPEAQRAFEVIIELDDPSVAEGLDEAPVDVEVETSKAENVLAVPVNALLALAEGGYAVEIVADNGTRLVAVDIGKFADGMVEVTGELNAGDIVLVAE